MNVSGKCGGCYQDWHSNTRDCPCGSFMHTWCGAPVDLDNPDGHGA